MFAEMVKATPALTSSLETMTSRGTYNKQLRRGAKRRQSSSSKSGSDDSGTNPNDVVERISTSRPVSPKASVEVSEDHISRTIPEGGNLRSFFHWCDFSLTESVV